MSFLDINDKNNKLNMFIKKYLNIASSSFVKSKNKNKNDNIVLTGNNFLGGNIIDELFPVDINEYTHENITSEIRNQIMNLDINNINIDNTYLNVKKYINTIDFPFLIKYERMMLTQILQSTQGTVTYQIYNIGVNNDNFLDRHTLPVNYLQQNNNYNPYRCILERINNNGEFVEYNYGTEWFFDNKLGYIFLFNEGTTINPLSVGVDIETGGHVFQLHLSNSAAMFERAFIHETNGNWLEGDIYFGFNISRVFTLNK